MCLSEELGHHLEVECICDIVSCESRQRLALLVPVPVLVHCDVLWLVVRVDHHAVAGTVLAFTVEENVISYRLLLWDEHQLL